MRQLFATFVCLILVLAGSAPAWAFDDRVESVALTSPAGGVRLNGTLRLPVGPGPFAAAVLLPEHGSSDEASADSRLLNNLADYLVSQGVVVLRLQERGRGSEGSATATTLAERSADATAALNYLRTRPQVDVTRLGLIGHGEGANAALLAGAQPMGPAFVVALAASGLPGRELLAAQPNMYGKVLHDSTAAQQQRQYRADLLAAEQEAASMRTKGSNSAQVQMYLDQQRLRLKSALRRDEERLVKHQRAMLEIVRQTADNAQAQAILSNMLHQFYPNITPADVQATVAQLTTPAYRSFLSFDPQRTLAGVQCPVLLLQGDADAEVNAAVNLPLLKKGLHGNARVAELRLPGLDHALRVASPATPVSPTASFLTAESDIRTWILSQK